MKKLHVTAFASWDAERERLHPENPSRYRSEMKRMDPGAGERFVIRVERESDAIRYHRLKWYYGYICKQVSEHTGYPVPEVDAMFRALFMPADVPTLHLMTDDQMKDFNTQAEHYSAETIGVEVIGPDDARHWKVA